MKVTDGLLPQLVCLVSTSMPSKERPTEYSVNGIRHEAAFWRVAGWSSLSQAAAAVHAATTARAMSRTMH
jgi:hypothetical protein